MSLALYMDVHVPAPTTRGLRLRGIDVLTAQEDATETLHDPHLLDRATRLGRVLITQDEDLVKEAVGRQRAGEEFGGLIYAPQRSVSIGACVRDLELIAKAYNADELLNQIMYLPLR